MESNFQKIKELLQNSILSKEDQDDLVVLFSLSEDSKLEPVVKLFSENKNWIKKISDNYKTKKEAIVNKNPDLWQKIIEDEEKQLNELEK